MSSAKLIPAETKFHYTVPLRTRWVDEDNQRVLNNAIYMTLFEEARLFYFGKTNLDLLPESLTFPFVLLKTDIRFLKSGKGGRDVLVDIKTIELHKSSFVQYYRVREATTDDVWSEAEAVLVSYDVGTKKKFPIPDEFRSKVAKFEGIVPLTDKKSVVQTNYKEREEVIQVGHWASIETVFDEKELRQFAELSEDYNPIHLDKHYAATTRFKQPIVHGQLYTSLLSGLLGMTLPGKGAVYVSQAYQYKAPLFVGEKVLAKVEVTDVDEKRRIVTLSTKCFNPKQTLLMDGVAKLMVPEARISSKPASKL